MAKEKEREKVRIRRFFVSMINSRYLSNELCECSPFRIELGQSTLM
jgi:hypothetical protein